MESRSRHLQSVKTSPSSEYTDFSGGQLFARDTTTVPFNIAHSLVSQLNRPHYETELRISYNFDLDGVSDRGTVTIPLVIKVPGVYEDSVIDIHSSNHHWDCIKESYKQVDGLYSIITMRLEAPTASLRSAGGGSIVLIIETMDPLSPYPPILQDFGPIIIREDDGDATICLLSDLPLPLH